MLVAVERSEFGIHVGVASEQIVGRKRPVCQHVVADPPHAVTVANQPLEIAVGMLHGGPKFGIKGGGYRFAIEHRGGRPLSAGDIRRGPGRQVPRINGHVPALAPHQDSACQTDGTAADDGAASTSGLKRELHREVGCAPGERDSSAAMAVVVHDGLVAESFRPDDESGAAKRPESGDSPDYAVRRYLHATEGKTRRGVITRIIPRAGNRAGAEERQQSHGGHNAASGNGRRRCFGVAIIHPGDVLQEIVYDLRVVQP